MPKMYVNLSVRLEVPHFEILKLIASDKGANSVSAMIKSYLLSELKASEEADRIARERARAEIIAQYRQHD
jgi:FMN-dependent NADH-azoreductase